jgi:SAM-dependent methyltransferase
VTSTARGAETSETTAIESCLAGCRAPLVASATRPWGSIARCSACGGFVLRPSGLQEDLNRGEVASALRELRRHNYERIVRRLGPAAERKLLDVGCSLGWFLEAASAGGYQTYGIEPDPFFESRIDRTRLPAAHLAQGYFPEDLPADWTSFDVITFHDVLEHLPDPAAALRACRERLNPDGKVVLSIPVADGFAFRLARLLSSFGLDGALERVFQVHYPYPHLFYPTRRSLAELARHTGFRIGFIEPLRSFHLSGVVERARMDATGGALSRAANAAALVLFALIEPLLPADSVLAVLEATGDGEAEIATGERGRGGETM